MKDIDADYVFSLGTTDWLEDDELDHMFYISRNSENLHSISEDRNSFTSIIAQILRFFIIWKKNR